jgi:hypothetical protein
MSNDSDIMRPSRGHWMLTKYANEEPKSGSDSQQITRDEKDESFREESFYEPFAEWLWRVEQEVNGVHIVGGNTFRSKWATPDVIGTYKKQPSDPVNFPLELVSAEIKIDPSQSVTAFGQACAYRLFSHKVYIVMPAAIKEVKDDLERLEALCTLFGMGLRTQPCRSEVREEGFGPKERARFLLRERTCATTSDERSANLR